MDLVDNGERVRDRIVARVVWPRETYVRARVVTTGNTAAGVISARATIDVPRETIATVVHLTGPAPVMPKPDRAKVQAKDLGKPSTPPPKPSKVSERQAQPSEPDLRPDSDHADSEALPRLRGLGVERANVPDRMLAWVVGAVRHEWPTRPHGLELVPEFGDDVTLMVFSRDPEVVDVLVGKIHAVGDETLDLEVIGNLSKHGFGVPVVGHGYMVGDRVTIDRRIAISIIKPAPVMAKSRLVAKSRHKRYRVRVGDLIELSPDTVRELPPDSTWKPSRSDVTVRVVEQDSTRSVIALDGPAGEVNVALVTSTNGKPRTICSWKFEIAENAAARTTG